MELFPKPPPCTSMYYTSIPEASLKTSAKSWRRSSSSYGDFFSTIPLQQIEERLNSIATNTEAFDRELESEDPPPFVSTSHASHAPMPDRAIQQHFIHKRTSASLVDGSGQAQVVEIPLELAAPNFYFLRDADGSRRVLEVTDPSLPPTKTRHEEAMATSSVRSMSNVQNSGMQTRHQKDFVDMQSRADKLEKRAREIGAEREQRAASTGAYGETERMTIPRVFKYEHGATLTKRDVEIMMKTRKPNPHPPSATVATAGELIYSSAEDVM
ncbi:hypothetical protein GUITHDRAFT_151392, partial [Guillardia theta CCMP2712]|mmetsp:Transcript_3157/g.10642  ORF Transcript_3157/g.10642 Transcript_3157/m.10642 type:complete len:270 (-) Transcript_3157:2506-3315(-)